VINRKFLFNVSLAFNQTLGNQYSQAWLVPGTDFKSFDRSKTEVGAYVKQVHHYERGHVQTDHNEQSCVQW
jgi:hypothetical protein